MEKTLKFIQWNVERLDELVNLWNDELAEHFPMRKVLFEQNSFQDKNVSFEGSLIAVDENDKVIGFIVAKRWQEQLDIKLGENIGWIQVILVDHKHRGQGIGTKLLKHAEDSLKAAGMKQILLGKDPWHYFPGIPEESTNVAAWFQSKGYVKFGTEHDLICTYDDQNNLSLPPVKEAEFSILRSEDQEAFLAFLRRCFPGRWEYEALHYFKKGGTGREFVVLKKNKKIIGFSRINDAESPFIAQNVYWSPLFGQELGGVGPLGIDANERKQGYGIAIVEAAIIYLRKRNVNTIAIDWTGLVAFYEKLGYNIWKSYHSYRKELTN